MCRRPRTRPGAHRPLRADAERRDCGHLRHRRIHSEFPAGFDREDGQKTPGGVHRFSEAARGQDHRRHLDRHAQPSPHAADHLGLPGGQGRLRGEALLAQHVRGAPDRRGGGQVQPHRAARHQLPFRHRPRGHPEDCGRGSSATSTWPAGSASSGATRSGAAPVEPVPAGVHYDLWLGPAPHARIHEQPLPLQLALVLGLRQRRPRQPGHPPGRYRALGPRREVSDQDQRHRAAISCSTTTRRRRTR